MKKKTLIITFILVIVGILSIFIAWLFLSGNGTSQYVKFRTSNLYYGAQSLIAYTETCGNTLTKYGNSGEYGNTIGNCNSATGIGNAPLTYLFDVHGKVTASGVDDDKIITATYLYKDSNGFLYVCSDFVSGGYHSLVYKESSAPFLINLGYDVSDVPNSVVPTMEVAC